MLTHHTVVLGGAHALWSWRQLLHGAAEQLEQATAAEGKAQKAALAAATKLRQHKGALVSTAAHQQQRCRLFRVRELALFFRCQQGTIDQYALGGYGGLVRSFGRWL